MTTDDMPGLAALAGLTGIATEDPAACALRLGAPTAYGMGLADVAMLADFALGGALRRLLGAGRILPTLTLTIEADAPGTPRNVAVHGHADRPVNGLGRAHGVLVHDGAVAGRCLATFAVPRSGITAEPLSWEEPGGSARTEAAERTVPALARGLGIPLDGEQSLSEALLRSCCTDLEDGIRLQPGPVLANRAGSVQGGVQFWLAARAPRVEARPVCGSLRFIAPAHTDEPMTATAHVSGAERGTVTAHTEIGQGGQLVASGLFTYRRTNQGRR